MSAGAGGLLAGIPLALVGDGPAVAMAGAWATGLGATVRGCGPGPGARLAVCRSPMALDGLPTGALDLAGAGALLGAALAGWRSGRQLVVDLDSIAAQVTLPLVVAAETSSLAAAGPSRPRPWGAGAVCADLGDAGEDAEAFDRLLDVVGPEAGGPEELARRAQEWRLPVTPYRPRPATAPPPWWEGFAGRAGRADDTSRRRIDSESPSADQAPLAGLTVVDLTVVWSGPLLTWLLAALGARVVKVEPASRPDGLRASPGGHLFSALNEGKEAAPLDLRCPADRAAFDELVSTADLVVDNLSPRAAANLGLAAGFLATPSLGLPAFAAGSPERDWVAYGSGVHATSGLGDVAGCPVAPVVTYPDPVTGFTGFAAALTLLLARAMGHAPLRAEVAMATAIGPLLDVPDDGALARRDPTLGARLAPHHRPPVTGPGLPVDLGPAPAPPSCAGPHG